MAVISKQRYVTPVDFAIAYAGMDDADETFYWLEKAHEVRATRIHELTSM
jgi:hypothetical protein